MSLQYPSVAKPISVYNVPVRMDGVPRKSRERWNLAQVVKFLGLSNRYSGIDELFPQIAGNSRGFVAADLNFDEGAFPVLQRLFECGAALG